MTIPEIVAALPRLKALVVGDICLDRWCTYEPGLADPSRETGLDRIAVTSFDCTPGGGGAVANNLAAFRLARVAVLGVAGEDGHGYELVRTLECNGIDADALIRPPGVCTFTYTKLINSETGLEDRPRVDFVRARELPESVTQQLSDRLSRIQAEFDVILIADQAETAAGGVVTDMLRGQLARLAAADPDKIVWADSRLRCALFRHITMKVNRAEAEAACLRMFRASDYERLRRQLCARRLFITDGARQTYVNQDGEVAWVSPRRVEQPVDICGAGDSFSAGAACALAAGATAVEAARFGNLVAAVTIMKPGTGTASPQELLNCALADGADGQVV